MKNACNVCCQKHVKREAAQLVLNSSQQKAIETLINIETNQFMGFYLLLKICGTLGIEPRTFRLQVLQESRNPDPQCKGVGD